jgi:uncharacterized iron-regulated membrane protein
MKTMAPSAAVQARPPRSAWQRWVARPQSLWARKALFQIHLWTGIGVGVYMLVISISGSAVVFRRQITRKYSRRTLAVASSGRPRLSIDELKQRAQHRFPQYEVYGVYASTRPDRPDEIVLGRRLDRISHLFDPYTGADLGDTESKIQSALEWMVDLHDNLLGGQTGRIVNGFGAVFTLVLALTGTIIWWPGIKQWRRSLWINWRMPFARLNWDLHSAIGFWCFLFVVVWGLSGVYLSFPGSFDAHIPDRFLATITRLHFGRYNTLTETVWTFLGLVPAILFITGALMWWNRVLRKKLRQFSSVTRRQAIRNYATNKS